MLTNAIKFTHPKGKIYLTSEVEGSYINTSIIGEYVGMSNEQVNSLFDNIQVSNTQKGTTGEKGTGIGLLLVKEFIENNQGAIKGGKQGR